MFFCIELANDTCVSWVALADTYPDNFGWVLGGAFFSVTVIAWSAKMIARLILNSWSK